jgi:hypothetical protein
MFALKVLLKTAIKKSFTDGTNQTHAYVLPTLGRLPFGIMTFGQSLLRHFVNAVP